ncbi:MAG: hypothetical protein JNM27_21405 [Leptospirales bacterium]|nr:hypothetical protein [Leptospirales bacterium]
MKKQTFFGLYTDYKPQIVRSLGLAIGIVLFGYPISSVLQEFNANIWKLETNVFAVSFLTFVALAALPLIGAGRKLFAGIVVVEHQGFTFGEDLYRWGDITDVFLVYDHVVIHEYVQHGLIYNGSTNRLYQTFLVRSNKRDFTFSYLKERFAGTRSSPDQNELPPFPTEDFFALHVGMQPHLLVLARTRFEDLRKTIESYSGKAAKSLKV